MVIVRDRKGQALFGRDLIRDLKVDMGPHVNLNSVAPLEANKETENTLKNEFRELFEPGHGTYKGPAVELKFKKTPEPVFLKSRPVPFALVEKVSKELDRLEAEGSLKRVMNSDFASPLVIIPKANNEIRLCVDFKRTINPQLDVDEYPLPTPESIFQQLNGGKLFSKIDLKAAFNQLRLSEKAQEYLRRLQRWAIRLMQYTFEIQYVSTDKFGNADGLSRLPDPAEKPEKFRKMEERHVLAVEAEQSWPISLSKVRKLTQGDKVLQEVLAHIRKGWPAKCPSDKLVPYFRKRHSLTIVKGCIVKGHRIVIPRELRQRILTELHGAHDGATRMYSLAQQNYWFPNMEQEIKRYVSLCADCAVVGKDNVRVPIQLWSRPNNPWERIHIDLCGPLHGKMWLIVVDSYSKWPEAIDMGRNTTSKAVISKLRNLFSIHGIPEQIVSDNGTQFTSSEMANFCRLNKIEQNFSAPEKQSSNGQAERMVQTFKNAIRKFGGDDSNISLKVTKWLFSYRITPHPATGKSPSELLMGRKLRSRLNILPRQPQKVSKGEQKAVSKYRQKLAENANKGRREKKFAQGDLVYARKFNDPRIRWIPGVVSELIGQRLLAIQTEFGVLKRHYDQV
uniref:RNA-directed DNA polymerase n=1 Tax=Bursaphelenchus xylophilus TaxID=6326 RepID=A0A1I7SI47_BURXY